MRIRFSVDNRAREEEEIVQNDAISKAVLQLCSSYKPCIELHPIEHS